MKIVPIVISMFMVNGCQATEKSLHLNKNSNQNTTVHSAKNHSKDNKPINVNFHSNKNQNDASLLAKETHPRKDEKVILDVPLIAQKPELKFGCEVASLTMLLKYAGFKVNKMQLANQLKRDNDPIKRTNQGDILEWGDPDKGFVGDMTGRHAGYAAFDKPLEDLMRKYLRERTLNLTGKPFSQLLKQVRMKKPVVVWTTGDYRLPNRWETWRTGSKTIKTPLDLHVVVLVGYDSNYVYVNDPLSAKKSHKIKKDTFIKSWVALEKRALSYL